MRHRRQGWEEGWIQPEPPAARTGKKVAVVGSGPAGLCAAAQINRAGHLVTVFERADRVGGLLMYGIPNMKLDKKVVLRRVKQMEEEGVAFLTGDRGGRELSGGEAPAGIRRRHPLHRRDQAPRSAHRRPASARRPFRHGISPGQHPDACSTATTNIPPFPPPAKTSSSSAAATPAPIASAPPCGTAAAALAQLEILPRPPLERARDNPWPEWPKIYKLDYGQEEAAAKFGGDPRVYLTTAKKFEGDAHGRVKDRAYRAN